MCIRDRHSTASDGSLTPEHLIAGAAAAGLAAVALTDHDTLDGVEEALSAGRRCDLEVLPGIEISASTEDLEIHLLGYDPLFPEKISAVLDELRRERYLRMEKMLARLRRLGFGISDVEVISEAGSAAPGRLHLARLMVKLGYTPDIDTAFSLYLERGRPAFVPVSYTHLDVYKRQLFCRGPVMRFRTRWRLWLEKWKRCV